MKTLNWQHRFLMIVALFAVPVLTSIGCDGFVGGDDCVTAGCSGTICGDPEEVSDILTSCEYRSEYACYKQHGICERDANDQCGWRDSQALKDCIATESMPTRTPATGQCVRNSTDACTTDADCVAGGCGGEYCHGVANMGASTCDCTAPLAPKCGCVNGVCSWWE
jgi:hypothetical protein